MSIPHDANPVADLRAAADHIASQSGYQPTQMFMSAKMKTEYENFEAWYSETKKQLERTSRRRWMTRLVLSRQLYGPLLKRQKKRLERKIRYWWYDRKGWPE